MDCGTAKFGGGVGGVAGVAGVAFLEVVAGGAVTGAITDGAGAAGVCRASTSGGLAFTFFCAAGFASGALAGTGFLSMASGGVPVGFLGEICSGFTAGFTSCLPFRAFPVCPAFVFAPPPRLLMGRIIAMGGEKTQSLWLTGSGWRAGRADFP